MTEISIVAAVASDGAIGRGNGLLCRLKGDMKYFKNLTMAHTIIMGRKTFLSLPKGALPGRRNIVVTRSGARYPGTVTYPDLSVALTAEMLLAEKEIFIIGGEEIYRQTIDVADRLYITEIGGTFPDADKHFPPIDLGRWREISRQENPADGDNPYPYAFVVYDRKER